MKSLFLSLIVLVSTSVFAQDQHFELPVKELDSSAQMFNHKPKKLILDYYGGGLGAIKATFVGRTVYEDSVNIGDTVYLAKKTYTDFTVVLPKSLAESAVLPDKTLDPNVVAQLLSIFGLTLISNQPIIIR